VSAKIGVLRFPGTNCDQDIWKAVEWSHLTPEYLWHQDTFKVEDYEGFIVPGGFSYGDYLRSGALAAHAPAMNSLREAAQKGFPIFGICNGFQILCEAQLLPGVLMRNAGLRFIDQMIEVKTQNSHQRFGAKLKKDQVCKMPIAHADGLYFVSNDELKNLQDGEQIFCTYMQNPNGSIGDIAGVMNQKKNVVAMMPHPERALYEWMGSSDGQFYF
jgi:phosphoribosylformylglycinamidine synthase subunit PurQ / glutaminase